MMNRFTMITSPDEQLRVQIGHPENNRVNILANFTDERLIQKIDNLKYVSVLHNIIFDGHQNFGIEFHVENALSRFIIDLPNLLFDLQEEPEV
jgi:hypothetical protein